MILEARKLWLVLSVLTILGLLFAGCAPAVVPTPTPTKALATPSPAKPAVTPIATPSPAAEQPRYGGILTVAHGGDPPSLDLHQESSILVLGPLGPAYNGLIEYDPLDPQKIIGVLAEKWDTSADGKVITFNLRKGVKWHDGKSLTAEDVKFSLERMSNPPKGTKAPRAEKLAAIDKVEIADPNTVKVTMKYPSAPFIPQLATSWMVIMPKHVIEAKGDMMKTVVGTGAYKLKGYSPGVSVEVVKTPDFFISGRPYLDGITFYIIKDAATRFAAFRTGQVKMTAMGYGPLKPSEAETLGKQMPQVAIYRQPTSLSMVGFAPLFDKAPWNDVRVRRAAHLAFDRQAAIKIIAEGAGELGGAMPPGTEWAIPQEEIAKMPGYRQPKDQDIAEAKKLLAEAGFPNGLKTTMIVASGKEEQRAVELIAEQLAKVGILAEIGIRETAVWNTLTLEKRFDTAAVGGSGHLPDPDEWARYYVGVGQYNTSALDDPKVTELFDKQRRALDTAERKKVAQEIDRTLIDLAARIIIYWYYQQQAVYPDVKNYKPGTSWYTSNRFQDVWLAK